MFDLDKDGEISFEELKKVAADLGEDLSDQELMDMIKGAKRTSNKGEKEKEKLDKSDDRVSRE